MRGQAAAKPQDWHRLQLTSNVPVRGNGDDTSSGGTATSSEDDEDNGGDDSDNGDGANGGTASAAAAAAAAGPSTPARIRSLRFFAELGCGATAELLTGC